MNIGRHRTVHKLNGYICDDFMLNVHFVRLYKQLSITMFLYPISHQNFDFGTIKDKYDI